MATGATVRADAPLRMLIDSNVFIALEPYAGQLEAGQAPAARLVRLVSEQGHRLFVHPASRDDLLQGKDPIRGRQRLAEFAKFPQLAEVKIPKPLLVELGEPTPGSNDHRDMRLLAALYNNAATYLVTDDAGLRKRAARINLDERVLTLIDAVEMLQQLAPTVSTPPPRVRRVDSYALDAEQDIFTSLREDYPEFDEWLDTKVRPDPDNRYCVVVEQDDCYAALAIVKRVEPDCAYPFQQPVTKVATFKVNGDYAGSKYGELLLKTLFADAHDRHAGSIYVEVLPKHELLVELLHRFGFEDSGHRTPRGELVTVKQLVHAHGSLSALEFHVRYGPPAIRGTAPVYVVPIQPRWHRQLFPDSPIEAADQSEQLEFPLLSNPLTHPWGNALQKAYLSTSRINKLKAGDTLLFYRSQDISAVTAVGVVEAMLRSSDAVEVMSFVGRRTVYTPSEITDMCERVGGVLAILFRQDRFIDPTWGLAELQQQGVVTAWPQSITQVPEKGAEWVHARLTESP